MVRFFSFIVCRFRTNKVEAHPIAYEHERMPTTGDLFIPTRHSHAGGGKQDVDHADWDHDIYSVGVIGGGVFELRINAGQHG